MWNRWRVEQAFRVDRDLVPRRIRPSGMPKVPVLIHCRVIYLDAGASVSVAWVGTHADACNLTGEIHICRLNAAERESRTVELNAKKRKSQDTK